MAQKHCSTVGREVGVEIDVDPKLDWKWRRVVVLRCRMEKAGAVDVELESDINSLPAFSVQERLGGELSGLGIAVKIVKAIDATPNHFLSRSDKSTRCPRMFRRFDIPRGRRAVGDQSQFRLQRGIR
jgi:hypothetical protein